jgi:hypothetical protein
MSLEQTLQKTNPSLYSVITKYINFKNNFNEQSNRYPNIIKRFRAYIDKKEAHELLDFTEKWHDLDVTQRTNLINKIGEFIEQNECFDRTSNFLLEISSTFPSSAGFFTGGSLCVIFMLLGIYLGISYKNGIVALIIIALAIIGSIFLGYKMRKWRVRNWVFKKLMPLGKENKIDFIYYITLLKHIDTENEAISQPIKDCAKQANNIGIFIKEYNKLFSVD